VEQSAGPSFIERSPSSSSAQGIATSAILSNRVLEPQFLCFVTNEQYGRRRLVSDWKEDLENQHHQGKCPEYLFIAYTAEQFNHGSVSDIQALHAIATKATRDAGLIVGRCHLYGSRQHRKRRLPAQRHRTRCSLPCHSCRARIRRHRGANFYASSVATLGRAPMDTS
jgi:hypothetical protein